jgi:hypothetical protein
LHRLERPVKRGAAQADNEVWRALDGALRSASARDYKIILRETETAQAAAKVAEAATAATKAALAATKAEQAGEDAWRALVAAPLPSEIIASSFVKPPLPKLPPRTQKLH